MELRVANGLLVIAQRLERCRREVQIEPGQARVIRAHDEIVTARMDLRQSRT